MSAHPSSLIEAIHYRLPYFTSSPFEGNTSNVTLDNVVDDILRAGGWAAIILCMALFLSIFTCCCCCFMCCACCIKRREKPFALKLLLGLVTGAIVLVGIVLLFVTFWAESSLHGSITGEASKVLNATDDIGAAVDGLVLFVEQKRHVVFTGYFVVLLLFLLVVLAVLALAPVCKSGIGVIVVIVMMGFFTVFNSMIVAATFAIIVVYADVCIGLFSLNVLDLSITDGPTVSTLPADISQGITDEWADYLDVFCNKSVNYGFTLFMLSAVLVVLFILIQIFGFAYGSSFFGRKPDTISVRASEVWNDDAIEDVEPTVNMVYRQQHYASEDEVPLMNVAGD